MKILVVDDEELVQVSVEADLADPQLAAKTGVHNEVTCVGNVSEAKALLEREVFDLAFLDIRLGPYHKSGGIELLRHIKKECLATVVIMMTSVEDTEVVEQCLLEGASDYVIKPFDSDKAHWLMLKARGMHKLVRKQQAQRSQAGPKSVKSIPLTTKSPLFQRVIDQATKLVSGALEGARFRRFGGARGPRVAEKRGPLLSA